MRPRTLVCITLLAVCHLQLDGQALTNALPPPQQPSQELRHDLESPGIETLPEDPGQELVPLATPEPLPQSGTPVDWEASRQEWAGDVLTLTGDVTAHFQDYVIRADKVTYNRATTELEVDGNVQVSGGPNDVLINATHGDMRLNMHTARFYNVNGTQGVRKMGHTVVYSTPNPLQFWGRVLLQTGEGRYQVVDGSITNCRLPHPDWKITARSINLSDGEASTTNAFFKFLGVPVLYLPYLRHPADRTGRVSGLLVPTISNGSSIRGYTFGEQMYWVINRSMDMVVGAEYFSKRGWAPNGDFRYKGPGLDHLFARWNALLDRGIDIKVSDAAGSATTAVPGAPAITAPGYTHVNQGGLDLVITGRKDLSNNTRVGGTLEYLSSYVYRLVFNDNYSQATSSQVVSDASLTQNHNGKILSAGLTRFQSFASTTNGDEVRILRLPLIRFDVLEQPLGNSPFYWGLASSIGYLNRAEPYLHSRNVGRIDFFPHLSLPLAGGGWNLVAEAGLRDTQYTLSQEPALTGARVTPKIIHTPLNRKELEASVLIRPPALERDYDLKLWGRKLRHVVEPEFNYKFAGGIGSQARNVPLFDTTDIATDVNEGGFSLTQRFYLRRTAEQPCIETTAETDPETAGDNSCASASRQWITWRIAQEYFIDSRFGGALIEGRRNVFESTLDLMAPTFLTTARNIAPISSSIRFEAVPNLHVEWDIDYDTIRGQFAANNLFTDYSFGRARLGIGHSLLNAVDEQRPTSTTSSDIKSQRIQPYLAIGKTSGSGFNFALNGGYDYVLHQVQYGGVQAAYNWDCCGLSLGYRRYQLGTVGLNSRDETQWLYSFTLANFGSVGDIRRVNSIFQ